MFFFMIGVDLRNLQAKLHLSLKKFLDTIVTSFTIKMSFMLTALIVSYAGSFLMHLTATMSYYECKGIQILCAHVIQRACSNCEYHQFLHCVMNMTSWRLHNIVCCAGTKSILIFQYAEDVTCTH